LKDLSNLPRLSYKNPLIKYNQTNTNLMSGKFSFAFGYLLFL